MLLCYSCIIIALSLCYRCMLYYRYISVLPVFCSCIIVILVLHYCCICVVLWLYHSCTVVVILLHCLCIIDNYCYMIVVLVLYRSHIKLTQMYTQLYWYYTIRPTWFSIIFIYTMTFNHIKPLCSIICTYETIMFNPIW